MSNVSLAFQHALRGPTNGRVRGMRHVRLDGDKKLADIVEGTIDKEQHMLGMSLCSLVVQPGWRRFTLPLLLAEWKYGMAYHNAVRRERGCEDSQLLTDSLR